MLALTGTSLDASATKARDLVKAFADFMKHEEVKWLTFVNDVSKTADELSAENDRLVESVKDIFKKMAGRS